MRLGRRLALAYGPCGVLEEEQVRTIIETRWQLRRANVVDTELYRMYSVYEGEPRGVGTAFAQDATQGNAFTKLTRYQSFLLRKLALAQKELARLQEIRNGQAAAGAVGPVGQVVAALLTPACAVEDAGSRASPASAASNPPCRAELGEFTGDLLITLGADAPRPAPPSSRQTAERRGS